MRGEFVEVGGRRLYYYAAGSRGGGTPAILLHGFPTSSRLWHAVARDFPPGHRLIIADLPGFGRSEANEGALDVESHATAVLGILDDLRVDRLALVGHGVGAAVAMAVARRAPDRVSHLGLVSAAAFGAPPRRLALFARMLGRAARRLPPGLLASLVHGSVLAGFAAAERSRLTLDTCLQPFTDEHGRDLLVRHLAALRQREHAAAVTARLERLAAERIPTAILWGEDDPFYPVALARRLQRALPGATLDIVAGASHFLPEDAPDRVVAGLAELFAC